MMPMDMNLSGSSSATSGNKMGSFIKSGDLIVGGSKGDSGGTMLWIVAIAAAALIGLMWIKKK